MAIWHCNGLNYARVRRILNLSLAPVILVVFALAVFLFNPSVSNAQNNISRKSIEVDLFVDSLSLLRPEVLLEQSLRNGGKTNLTIDNRPSGQMTIKSVKQLPITLNVTQPDGSVKELPDPRAKFETNMFITLTGFAQIQSNSTVLGESLVKIGSPAEIEGFNYDINATVVDLRTEN